jgi:hypothetical protein
MAHDPHEAFRQIGKVLSDCLVKDRRPTKDELFAMLSWAMAGMGATKPDDEPDGDDYADRAEWKAII